MHLIDFYLEDVVADLCHHEDIEYQLNDPAKFELEGLRLSRWSFTL